APGMPRLGEDFVRAAYLLGEKTPASGSGTKRDYLEVGPVLRKLYKRALYDKSFALQVKCGYAYQVVQFIPGHIWWPFEANGPRRAKVMMVGKCPGQVEHNQQCHFSPKEIKVRDKITDNSTQVLWSILKDEFGAEHALHIPEDGEVGFHNWYVTNVLKF